MKSITAIYDNGAFRPETPVDLPPGVRVEVLIPEGLQTDITFVPMPNVHDNPPPPVTALTKEDASDIARGTDEGLVVAKVATDLAA